MSPVQIAGAVLMALLWGLQYVIIKVGLTALPPLLFLSLRFAAVAAILLPFVAPPSRREVGHLAITSIFFGGLNFSLVFMGLRQGHAGVSAVVYQLSAPFSVLLAWPLLGERPTLRALSGMAIALAGIVLIAIGPGASARLVPTLLVLFGGLALALGSVLAKRFGSIEPMKQIAWISVFAAPQVFLASLLIEHHQTESLRAAGLHVWMAFVYTVLLGGILGWGLWFWLLAKCPVSRITPYSLLQIVFALIASVIFFKEPISPTLLAGAAICIVGVIITQTQPRETRSPLQRQECKSA